MPDMCHPTCYLALYSGCVGTGSCTSDGLTGAVCWANGFQSLCDISLTGFCTYTMNGRTCAGAALTTDFGTYPAVWSFQNASGAVLGTLTINEDHSRVAACADGSTATIPASCYDTVPVCTDGSCS